MMTQLTVKQGSVTDALGKVRSGWLIYEDGRPGYPYPTKEQAIKQAEGIKSIRCSSVAIKVVD